jgi:hypothetical protein
MADVEQRATAVRKNMERLRALRQAREAQGAGADPAVASIRKKGRKGLAK